MSKWYILRVFSGKEKYVAKALEEKGLFEEVFSPIEKLKKVSGKEIIEKESSLTKGYIWLKCEINDAVLECIKKTNYAVGFLGGAKNPQSSSEREMEIFKEQSKQEGLRVKSLFNEGDIIKIAKGPFTSFVGKIESISNDGYTADVSVEILGKTTKISVAITDLKADTTE